MWFKKLCRLHFERRFEMENKKKNKIEISKFEFEKTFFYSALIVVYFFFGLYIGENSAGAGGYDSDFS